MGSCVSWPWFILEIYFNGLIASLLFVKVLDVVQVDDKYWKSLVKNGQQLVPKLVLLFVLLGQLWITTLFKRTEQDNSNCYSECKTQLKEKLDSTKIVNFWFQLLAKAAAQDDDKKYLHSDERQSQ